MDAKDRRTPLPQLVATPTGYRVFDPDVVAARGDLDESRGRLVVQHGSAADVIALLGVVAAGVGASWALGGGIVGHVLWFVAGVVVAAGGWIAVRHDDPRRTYRETHCGAGPSVDVTDPTVLEICGLAERLAGTRAWGGALVDPDRRLAAVVWGAARAETGTDQVWANLQELLTIARRLDARTDPDARDLSADMLDEGRRRHPRD
ncbi:hypothetical protein [Actinomycetospora atypica]|uniref:Uncharacterized protein n=1 Tax=Actinomycetospora atypica TaxID=1290095 RepID=A0ABV9YHC4_9PSEU